MDYFIKRTGNFDVSYVGHCFVFFIKGLTRMTSVANVFTKQNYTNPALGGAVHTVGGGREAWGRAVRNGRGA